MLAHPNGSPVPSPISAALEVYLVTIGEGEYVWEKFGHNALWFRDTSAGIDVAYNWGIFDFAQPGFLRRFLKGDTRYWVEAYPGTALIDAYRRLDRTIDIQRLNLTPEQARRALDYSQWNAREENKYYRYDYFRDNCSTRIRDVIDLAVGGQLKAATADSIVKRTYRTETVRLIDDMQLAQFGILAALGQPTDRLLSEWEGMFIPMRMRDAIRDVRVRTPGGVIEPLVLDERRVYVTSEHYERDDVPTLWPWYLLIGLLFAAAFLAAGWAARLLRSAEIVFAVEVALWTFVTGLFGLVLLLAWTSTQHVFWYRNENLLLLNPLALWLAVLVPLSLRYGRFAWPSAILAIAIASLSVVALLVKAIPGFAQNNAPLALLLAPPHVALAYTLWRRAQTSRRTVEHG